MTFWLEILPTLALLLDGDYYSIIRRGRDID